MTTPKIKAAMQAINQDNVLKRHLTDIEGAEACLYAAAAHAVMVPRTDGTTGLTKDEFLAAAEAVWDVIEAANQKRLREN
jgi:hypothetical protein